MTQKANIVPINDAPGRIPFAVSMIGLIVPPVIAVMEPLRSVPKATSDGSSNYGFSPPFGVVFSAL